MKTLQNETAVPLAQPSQTREREEEIIGLRISILSRFLVSHDLKSIGFTVLQRPHYSIFNILPSTSEIT